MARRPRPALFHFVSALLLAVSLQFPLSPSVNGQSVTNSDGIYSTLRNLTLGTEAVSISNFDLKRDAGTFRFRSGTVCFVAPVNNRVTGAVFVGDGLFLLNPPFESERKSLAYLTKEPEFKERFEHLLLRFTDSTYEESKLSKPPILLQSFANENPPDWVQSIQLSASGGGIPGRSGPGAPLGSMNTTGLNKKALAESEIAVQIYSDYFGVPLFSQIHITQQTACNFGQSWPGLVWIPICYYFDTTVRHELGLDWGDRGYWKVVTPHEVAHQWWGHTVGFSSSRDQWMSEGFADMSASLYLSLTEKDPKKFITFWNDEREILLEKDAQGFRAIDVGPLTMGYRANNSRTGSAITRRLIYPKGAYVLHMLRMMMFDNHTGDAQFKAMMQDFVSTYRGKPATTEDFKAMVEKHMTRDMDLAGNHKMDWFFNEYVYGTQLPTYKIDYTFEPDPSGDQVFNFKLTQSNVDGNFRMLVPIYLELPDGRMFNLGHAHLAGNTTIQQKIPLKGLKSAPHRALINYYDDVLASPN